MERACRRAAGQGLGDRGAAFGSAGRRATRNRGGLAPAATGRPRPGHRPGGLSDVGPDGPADRGPDAALQLRFAKAVRVSIEGNAHYLPRPAKVRYGTDTEPGTLSGVSPGRPPRPTAPVARDESRPAPGYGETPELHDVPDPQITGPLDVIVRIGGAGVCRTDLHIIEGQWAQKTGVRAALHDRARERRLGRRGRRRGHQRGGRRHGHPASAGHLRALPGLPGRRRRALRAFGFPRHRHRRRLRRVPARPPPERSSNSTPPWSRPTSRRSRTPG